MARKPHPSYWAERNVWHTTIRGKRYWLGEHAADAPKPQKSKKTGLWNAPKVITDEFHKLMGTDKQVSRGSVWEVFCVQSKKASKAERTYDFYRERLQMFKDAVPNMPVEDLTPEHVYDWMSEKKWSDTYKHGIMTALTRSFNWAVKARKIRFNPIRGIEKPTPKHRENFLSQRRWCVSHRQWRC